MFPIVKMTSVWRRVDTTGEPCKACQEPIYGNQYQLHVNNQPTEQIVCEPCYQEVIKVEERD